MEGLLEVLLEIAVRAAGALLEVAVCEVLGNAFPKPRGFRNRPPFSLEP